MSVLKSTIRFCVLAAASLSGSWLFGQAYHPFAEPLEFDPDWQIFAPVHLQDVQELTPRQRMNQGWFLSYDRMMQGFSRPRNEGGTSSIDSAWGNRWDVGIATDKGGWLASVTRVNGPSNYDRQLQSRINLFNEDDEGDPINPLFPAGFRNDPQTGERSYFLQDSVNAGTYSNFEFSKTWRMTPYRYGGVLEPLVGLRFSDFKDIARDDNYTTTNTDLDGLPGAVFETLTIDTATSYNKMFLGQIGFRYVQFAERWTLSGQFRAFAGQNYQTQIVDISTFNTEYTAIGIGTDPTRFRNTNFNFSKNNSETTIGLDTRAEAAYKIAKNFQVRGGVNLVYFGTGIWRGATVASNNNPNLTNQALVMPGFTLGFEVNR
jgi:hypothetical protein